MNAYALVTLKYLTSAGVKATAAAGTVLADFDPDEFPKWEKKGYARKATIGEVAEAKANDTYRPSIEETTAPKKTPAPKKAAASSEKKAAAPVKTPAKDDGSSNGGDKTPAKDDDLA